MDKFYQRFKIDDHLKRHEKAIENLSLAGPVHTFGVFRFLTRGPCRRKSV
jgi:hypothetical protein